MRTGLILLLALGTLAPSSFGQAEFSVSHYERSLFCDDFTGRRLARRQWPGQSGAYLRRDESASGCVELSASRGAAQLELRSAEIDLEGAPRAKLVYALAAAHVEDSDTLDVEVADRAGGWILIDRVSGAEVSGEFRERTAHFPAEALHSGGRVRFRARPDDPGDTWRIEHAEVIAYSASPMHSLAIDVSPPLDIEVRVLGPDDTVAEPRPAPFERMTSAEQRWALIAPAQVDGWVFSQWLVNGAAPSTARGIVLSTDRDTQATLRYRNGPGAPRLAAVSVETSPPDAALIRVGLGPELLYDEVTSGELLEALVDETLTLVAPAREGGRVFLRWLVDGAPRADGENALTLRVDADLRLVAQYALLGDMNDDGRLDRKDVDLFILALADPAAFDAIAPGIGRIARGDMNGDGALNREDVDRFVLLVTGL